MGDDVKEMKIRGVPISGGVAIGKPYFFTLSESHFPEYAIREHDIDIEVSRFRKAVDLSRKDVKRLQKQLEKEGVHEAAAVLETHLQMLQDTLLTTDVEAGIRQGLKNAESVFCTVVQRCEKKFMSLPDLFFRERVKDVKDVARRVLSHLCATATDRMPELPQDAVVVAYELPTSEAAEASTSRVKGFLTAIGGATSHAAIVAKAKGIPCITEVDLATLEKCRDGHVVIDGGRGEIILNPTPGTLRRYRKLCREQEDYIEDLTKDKDLKAETQDGYRVMLSANVETVADTSLMHRYGSDGVGLFRSEYVLALRDQFPSEEEQYTLYRTLVERMQGLPIVMRAFDVGGDKPGRLQTTLDGDERRFGERAIRLLLQEPEIFRAQIRAMLRASRHGDVRILLPMIACPQEFQEAKALIDDVYQSLKKNHEAPTKVPPIGCMIEVPSAAVLADALAEQADFFSIGTNDLVQYTLAQDRSEQSSRRYSYGHPAILRLIHVVVTAAVAKGIPVTVCGEMAADPLFTPFLVGIGVQGFSVAVPHLPVLRRRIRMLKFVDAVAVADRALQLSDEESVRSFLSSDPEG